MADNVWTSTTSTDYGATANWSLGHVPQVGEDVWLKKGTANIEDGLGQSAVVLDSFTAMDGYTGTVGSAAGYLQVSLGSADRLTWSGVGLSYIDLNTSSTPDVIVKKTFVPQAGGRGLYLLGDMIDVLSVEDGNVGLAVLPGETAGVATAFMSRSSDLHLGPDSGVTNVQITDGVLLCEDGTSEIMMDGGFVTLDGTGAHADIIIHEGEIIYNTSGTLASILIAGGFVDFYQNGMTKTVTLLKLEPPGSYRYHPELFSLATFGESATKQAMTISAS